MCDLSKKCKILEMHANKKLVIELSQYESIWICKHAQIEILKWSCLRFMSCIMTLYDQEIHKILPRFLQKIIVNFWGQLQDIGGF